MGEEIDLEWTGKPDLVGNEDDIVWHIIEGEKLGSWRGSNEGLIRNILIIKDDLKAEDITSTMPDLQKDIITKRNASTIMSRIVNEQNAKRLGVDRKKIAELSALYSATVLKTLRQEYAATEPELIAKRIKNVDKKIRALQADYGIPFLDNHRIVSSNRHSSLKPSISWVEDDLIKILIRYFPGRTVEARQYIRMAGYEDREINDLVNRTAGRKADSEFLYRDAASKRAGQTGGMGVK